MSAPPVKPLPVLLHVGLIKTATTFLQTQVFDAPDEGLELAAGRHTRAELVETILLGDDFAFDAEAARSRLEGHAEEVRARGNLPVWSEEMLLGNPPSRRYDGFANARKLKAVYPQARVLVTLRRQQAIALSMYREYVLGGGALPLSGFVGTGQEAPGYSPVLRPEFLHYDRVISHYMGLFGSENVLVLPQEMLRADPAACYARLSAFTGARIDPDRPRRQAHVGEGIVAMGLRRRTNRLILRDPTRRGRQGLDALFDRLLRRLDRLVPAGWNARGEGRLKAAIAARYDGLFAESNARTAALTGLPLGDLGYDV